MKKQIKQIFALALIGAFMFSCGGGSSETAEDTAEHATAEEAHANDMDHGHDHDDMDSDSEGKDNAVIVSAEDFKSVSESIAKSITESYLELKDALVASDAEKSQEAASEILSSLKEVESSTAIDGLKEDAQHIVDTDELEHIREHFDLMSQNVYAMAKAKNTGMTLYKQYCPMAFDNEGAYWLSAKEEIRNPYFGDKMLKCGKVQETIAVN